MKSSGMIFAKAIGLVVMGLIMAAQLSGCATAPAPKPLAQQGGPASLVVSPIEALDEDQQLLLSQAQGHIQRESWAEARVALESLMSARPDHPIAFARLAWVAHKEGQDSEALDLYRQAFERDPRDAISANNRALLLKDAGRFAEAADQLREGLKFSPDTADLHFNLGVISELYLLDLETALKHYRQFSVLNDQDNALVAGWIADLERRVD